MPDWQADAVEQWKLIEADMETGGERFLELPDQFEFHEYEEMRSFAQEQERDAADKLLYAIRGSGAFRRFRDKLDDLGLTDAWYAYRSSRLRGFAVEYCEAQSLPYVDDLPPKRKA